MKVYVLIKHGYDGSDIIGIFESEEAAEKRKHWHTSRLKGMDTHYIDFEIEKHELIK
ncbi:hypothetical protein JC221_041 [Yersinia phage JC221]|nr:hypothetical protein JC221_041 [Yersinia phage JC221]